MIYQGLGLLASRFLSLLGLLLASSLALSTQNSSIETERRLFLQAEAALKQGKMASFQSLKKQLVHYPLYPYLIHAELNRRFASLEASEFEAFVHRYADSPLSLQLRQRWLYLQAKENKWVNFQQAYKPSTDTSLQCHKLWADLQTQPQSQALDNVMPLWLTGSSQPKACEPLFKAWQLSGRMIRPLIWQRIKLAIQAGNTSLAKKLSEHLPKAERLWVDLWIMVHENPSLIAKPHHFKSKHPAISEILVHGLSEIARKNPEEAIPLWKTLNQRYAFSERHWALVVRAIGLSLATQKNLTAEKWLTRVPDRYTNQAVHEWRVRVALLKEDWQTVLKWLDELPEPLANSEAWQYWRARALDRLGHTQASQLILTKLAPFRSYYGFLANQRLLKPYAFAQQKISVPQSVVDQVSKLPAILRAQELYHLGRGNQGHQEWQLALKNLPDLEKQAAARLALTWEAPNWSIMALAKSLNHGGAWELRFPMGHSHHILQAADRHQVDAAWIFAIARQESAFVTTARSPVGALGVMQLMPKTAEMLAKKLRHSNKSGLDLFEANTNIHLGSHYLKMMLENHQKNPVLATAAYNAGPGRVQKWLPDYDTAADAWIETIPYHETRDYVKNVLTATMIYQQLLGKKRNLTQHMPVIPGNT